MSTITNIRVHPSHGLEAAGLKGQCFEQPLAGLDVLVGSNGAGKTTRGILAFVAAQVGLATVASDRQRPYLGGLPANTAVTVDLDDGGTFTRELDGKPAAQKAYDAGAREVIGRPSSSWTLADFAQSTAGQRASILRDIALAGGALEAWDVDRARDRVQELLGERPEPESTTLVDLGAYHACVDAITTATDGAEWLAAADEWATEDQKTANKAQKTDEAAAKALVKRVPPTVPGDAEADAKRHRELTSNRAELTSPKAREVARRARESFDGERASRETSLAAVLAEGQRLKVAEPAPTFDTGLHARLEQAVTDARADLAAPIPEWAGADPVALARAVTEAQAAAEVAQAAQAATATAAGIARDAAGAARVTRDKAQARVTTSASALAGYRAQVKALEPLAGDAACVHCGAADPLGIGERLNEAQHAAQAASDEHIAALDAATDTQAALTRLETVERIAVRDATSAENAATNAAAALARAKTAQTSATTAQTGHADRIRTARTQALTRAEQALADNATRQQQASDAHAKREAARTAALKAARTRYTAAKEALDEWAARIPPEVPAEPDPEVLAAIDRDIAEVQARIDARAILTRWQADCATASATATSSWRYWVGSKALVDTVRIVAAEQRSAAYGPIDAAAKALLAGSGLVEPFFDGPGDYGATVPGVGRVAYHALSESEARITAAALVCALAEVSRQPVRVVLLDGLEVVQADHRAPLLAALSHARNEGRVDNVITTLATAPGDDTSALEATGFQVHRLALPDARPAQVEHIAPSQSSFPVDPDADDEEGDSDIPF